MFEFKPITFLIGKNSSGKSSLTKAIFFFHALFDEKNSKFSKYEFGNFKDYINFNSESKEIEFILPFAWPGINTLLTYHVYYKKEGKIPVIQKTQIKNKLNNTIIYESKFEGYEPILEGESIKNKIYWKNLYNLYKISKLNVIDTYNHYTSIMNNLGLEESNYLYPSLKHLQKLPLYPDFYKEYELFIESNEKSSLFPNLCNKSLSNTPIITITPMIFSDRDGNLYESEYLVIKNTITKRDINSRSKIPKELKLKKYKTLSLKDYIKENVVGTMFNYSIFNSKNKSYYKIDVEKLKLLETNFLKKCTTSFFLNSFSHGFPLNLITRNELNEDIEEKLLEDISIKFNGFEEHFSNFIRETNEKCEINLEKKDIQIQNSDFEIFSIYINNLDTKYMDEHMKILYSNFEFLQSFRMPQVKFIENKDYNKSSLHNFFVKHYIEKILANSEHINFWLKEFELADCINVTNHEELGIKTIEFIKSGKPINISDVGFGHVQILPILLRCCFSPPKVIIIEEPEANLHPALQSKLAEFFVYCHKEFGTQFIIETHSEYLIRKMQTLIRKGDFSSSDANIYYFNSESSGKDRLSKVKEISFEKSGILSDSFDNGFFDEADNLAMELLSLNYGQEN